MYLKLKLIKIKFQHNDFRKYVYMCFENDICILKIMCLKPLILKKSK